MTRSPLSALLSLTLVPILLMGCSSGGYATLPSAHQSGSLATSASKGPHGPSHVLWGVWHVTLDGSELVAQIDPLRGAAFTCNVTRFMQPPVSPVNLVSISFDSASDPASGYFVVNVTLRHPFPGLSYYNGFDVRGIMMSDGSLIGEHDSTVVRSGPGDTRLLNADGYTRFWNWPEFTSYGKIFGASFGKLAPPNQPNATVNPFKYFADGLGPEDSVNDLDPAERGFFKSTPGVNTRRYEIQFKMAGGKPVFDFNYAVDASWSEPDPDFAPNYPVEAFPSSANCAEAYNLSVGDAGSTAYYVDPTTFGGELILGIEVFDHQGAMTPSGVPAEISAIWLEGEVLDSPVDVLDTAVILPGSTIASSVFEVTLGSLNLTHSGPTGFFCTVESADPSTYQPHVPGGDLFDYPDAHLAAYFTFEAVIDDESPPSGPPTTPVVIDPDVPSYGTAFAIASDGIIHSVYYDDERSNAYWSYSEDLGNTWTNMDDPICSVEGGHFPPYEFISDAISMDAAGQYVYVLLSEYDGATGTNYCKLTGGRLNINDLDSGWETITVWDWPQVGDERSNFGRPHLSARQDGGILVVGLFYFGFGGYFAPSFSFAPDWADLESITRQELSPANGSLTYIYPRSSICLVNDGTDFYYATGGVLVDNDSGYGNGKMNSILKYEPEYGRWSFVQTHPVPDQATSYQYFNCTGLAIDSDYDLYWVFNYVTNNAAGGHYGWDCGDWYLGYGAGAASGSHDFIYTTPISETYHHRHLDCPGYYYACYDYNFTHSSIGVNSEGTVYICCESALNDPVIYGIKNDGSGWTDPVEIEGPDYYGHYPFARMHQSGWLMISFTDAYYDLSVFQDGSGLPYFVAWK